MFGVRKITSLLLITLVSLAGYAAPKLTTVNCKIYNNAGKSIFLYKVENGEAVSLGFRWPTAADTCQFSFPMEKEGIYYILQGGGKSSSFNHVIYMKPGDTKYVDIYAKKNAIEFDSCIINLPNKETVFLQQWTNLFNNYSKWGAIRGKREQYISEYSSFIKAAEDLKRKAVTNNHFFNNLFAAKINAEVVYAKAAAFFNYGRRMNAGVDTIIQHRSFYQALNDLKFSNAGILQSEHGLQLVKYWVGYKLFQKIGAADKLYYVPFVEKANAVASDSIRRAFVADRMKELTTYDQFKADIQPYKHLFNTTASRAIYQNKEDELTVYAKGAPAYNFSLADTKDKTVSLADFKGKVVVMDIWAMWCAPCLQEKPYFQKVEEEYKDRDDIVFIGVSHDGVARKDVWKAFVAKKGWEGIELIANYNESIGKYYKIVGIPRLMIFDKEGKIVTVDAPRPSNPAFKKLIEQTLKTTDRATNP